MRGLLMGQDGRILEDDYKLLKMIRRKMHRVDGNTNKSSDKYNAGYGRIVGVMRQGKA